jgi:uncharacterized alkaline shock family protein YloU
MGTLDRMVIGLSGLVFLVLSLLFCTLALGWNLADDLVYWVDYLARFGRLEATVLAALAFLATGYLFCLSFKGLRQAPSLVQEGEHGQIRISFTTLENLVQKAAQEINGVRDVQTKISNTSQGVQIILGLKVNPGINIPQVAEMVQSQVREFLLTTAGVEIARIQVDIKNITREAKVRVE